jgi:5-(carboxyamino)imidazole ribonucleotide synthase
VETPVVGVVGAGQLARMMQQAAIGLGIPLKLLAEAPDASAAAVIPTTQVGDYRDLDTLRSWAQECAVVTFDHEHVPTGHLDKLIADGIACRPGPGALVHAQDKAVMRARLRDMDVACPAYALVETADDVEAFAEANGGFPIVLKATRGGYDGRGVWFVEDHAAATEMLCGPAGEAALLAEERVGFVRELSALVARAPSGQQAAYPVVQSVQREGICVEVIAPAPGISGELALQAQSVAMRIAAELDVIGILAVELFETLDGRILVNELAMRPHNTGHWSIDGAVTSQFENHLRAVLDLPLGSPASRSAWTVMVNILGGTVSTLYDGYPHVLARDPAVRVHLYGKSVRPGRKIGHVTAYGDDLDGLLERTRHAARWFEGSIDEPPEEG